MRFGFCVDIDNIWVEKTSLGRKLWKAQSMILTQFFVARLPLILPPELTLNNKEKLLVFKV